MFRIAEQGFNETTITEETPVMASARAKLEHVIDRLMRPPLSQAAQMDAAEFGKP